MHACACHNVSPMLTQCNCKSCHCSAVQPQACQAAQGTSITQLTQITPHMAGCESCVNTCMRVSYLSPKLSVTPTPPPLHLIQQDVSCHEHWVGHESRPDVLPLLACLLLELDHAVQPANGCHTLQQPVELSMGGHVTLDKYRCLRGQQAATAAVKEGQKSTVR